MENSVESRVSGRDPELWAIAKRRAGFKTHLGTYIVVNGFLWAIWFFSDSNPKFDGKFPWPIWSTLGWGIGLLFHFLGAYVYPRETSTEKEYEKLLRNKK